MFGQYGNFMNDPAAQLASQFGQTAFKHGQEYLEHNASAPALAFTLEDAVADKRDRSTAT